MNPSRLQPSLTPRRSILNGSDTIPKREGDVAKITVRIEGGEVKAVDGVPVEMYIEVRNYDVDPLSHGALSHYEEGRLCEILERHAPE